MIDCKCDCGKVAFRVGEIAETATACHCGQCRRASGHYWVSARAPDYDALEFSCDEGLVWFASSDFARRGFCKFCGASLFYRKNDEKGVAIAAGCMEAPTNLRIGRHIFVADKGDYYEITDGLPQVEKW